MDRPITNRECGRIVWFGYERYDDGTPEVRHSTTSFNVLKETSLLDSFLELERAHRLRQVPIAPHAIGALVVVSPDVSLWTFVRSWWAARRTAKANAAKGWE